LVQYGDKHMILNNKHYVGWLFSALLSEKKMLMLT